MNLCNFSRSFILVLESSYYYFFAYVKQIIFQLIERALVHMLNRVYLLSFPVYLDWKQIPTTIKENLASARRHCLHT